MLIEFTVGNYRSFKEPQTLSFQSMNRLREHPGNQFKAGKLRLLKSIGIYGPNGGGKSNLLKALHTMTEFVQMSSSMSSSNPLNVQPFALDEFSASKPTLFELVFMAENKVYTYGMELTSTKVISEYLYAGQDADTIIFKRTVDGLDKDTVLDQNSIKLFDLVRENGLYLSVLDSLNVGVVKPTLDIFNKILFVGSTLGDEDWLFSNLFFNMKDFQNDLINFLSALDLKLHGIKQGELNESDTENSTVAKERNQYQDIQSIHKVYNSKGKVINTSSFNFNEFESHGTKVLLAISGKFLVILRMGYILIFDEIEAGLHPYQVINLINMFGEANANNAQLLFTTHSTSLLDRAQLRRDQIYFVDKDEVEASKLYALAEFKGKDGKVIRKDKALEDMYLAGKFGAVPYIQP